MFGVIKRKLGPKGQIVIPKDIRDGLGLKEGTVVSFEVREDGVLLRPVEDPENWLKGFLSIVPEGEKTDLKPIVPEEEVIERWKRVKKVLV